ncbi:hypothetical protein ACHAPJ_012374 [Fusarium lateritium]
MKINTQKAFLAFAILAAAEEARSVPRQEKDNTTCRKTKVAILGAGMAGLSAGWALSNASISDFVIVEHNDYLGGRIQRKQFGKKPDGTPYIIELGANWFHSIGPNNPVWQLGQKYGIESTYSNYSSLLTYDHTGAVDYLDVIDDLNKAVIKASVLSADIFTNNLQDISVRNAYSLGGWRPLRDMHAQAAEWMVWDFDFAAPPDRSSAEYMLGIEATLEAEQKAAGEEPEEYIDNFVVDPRGYGFLAESVAAEYLEAEDKRILLDTTVSSIEYGNDTVKVHFKNGDCLEAEHAICTFSVGVLKSDTVEFKPELPDWKKDAIEVHDMATYTKIFLQFNETFWDTKAEFLLYADPVERGRYPFFQSLDHEGFMEGSHIIFVTVTEDQSYKVENQSDEVTKAEIMDILRKMYPDITVPEPTDFYYPRWSQTEWSYGSYSTWPVGVTTERHQNFRANVGRVWFAGEGTSLAGRCTVTGAYEEGAKIGQRIANVINGTFGTDDSGPERHYESLHGASFSDSLIKENGWDL